MSKTKVTEKKRRFPWKVREPKKWGSPVHLHRKVDAFNARLVDGIGALGFLLFGCVALIVGNTDSVAVWVGVVFIVIGLILGGIAVYAHLSCREEEKMKAEDQAAREEKQRLWREKRRAERNAKRKK